MGRKKTGVINQLWLPWNSWDAAIQWGRVTVFRTYKIFDAFIPNNSGKRATAETMPQQRQYNWGLFSYSFGIKVCIIVLGKYLWPAWRKEQEIEEEDGDSTKALAGISLTLWT